MLREKRIIAYASLDKPRRVQLFNLQLKLLALYLSISEQDDTNKEN